MANNDYLPPPEGWHNAFLARYDPATVDNHKFYQFFFGYCDFITSNGVSPIFIEQALSQLACPNLHVLTSLPIFPPFYGDYHNQIDTLLSLEGKRIGYELGKFFPRPAKRKTDVAFGLEKFEPVHKDQKVDPEEGSMVSKTVIKEMCTDKICAISDNPETILSTDGTVGKQTPNSNNQSENCVNNPMCNNVIASSVNVNYDSIGNCSTSSVSNSVPSYANVTSNSVNNNCVNSICDPNANVYSGDHSYSAPPPKLVAGLVPINHPTPPTPRKARRPPGKGENRRKKI